MTTHTDFPYSVLLPVYYKDSPEYLKVAVDSMLAQTVFPEEIMLAIDGEIGEELWAVIRGYQKQYKSLFTVCAYEKNQGLGALLRKTVPLCRNEYIARMDADDWSVSDRIQKQLEVLKRYPDINVVGSNVNEFENDIRNPLACVILPEIPEENLKFAKRRCPIRHPTLLYKKSDIISAGNYNSIFSLEDYDLIVRMFCCGMRLYNVQEPLVYMRINRNFYRRRGGFRYLVCMVHLKFKFLKIKFMSLFDFFISCGGQTLVILMPEKMREWFYMKFLRKTI